jgi:hypothetical protein
MRAVLAAALFLVACGPSARNGRGDDDDGTGTDAGNGSDPGTPRECNKMDIVFVVDDSGSMAEEQSNLATNFPMFASILSQYTTSAGEHLDFRVGITTTGRPEHYSIDLLGQTIDQDETGPNGKFETGCNGTNPWVASADANGSTVMSCRANVGTSGASIEMPMLMAKRALSDRIMDGANGAFLRADALLATVMITDEDDQSYAGPSDDYRFTVDANGNGPIDWNPQNQVDFMDQLKGNRANWAAAVIAGDGSCSSNFGDAVDGTRLKQFIQLTGTNGVFSSICDGDLSIGLKKAIDSFQAACGNIIF